jgi:hypothetical protein
VDGRRAARCAMRTAAGTADGPMASWDSLDERWCWRAVSAEPRRHAPRRCRGARGWVCSPVATSDGPSERGASPLRQSRGWLSVRAALCWLVSAAVAHLLSRLTGCACAIADDRRGCQFSCAGASCECQLGVWRGTEVRLSASSLRKSRTSRWYWLSQKTASAEARTDVSR